MTRSWFYWTWVLCLAALGQARSAAPDLRFNNGIIAIVNDTVITYQELLDITAQQAEAVYRSFRNRPAEYERRLAQIREDGLAQLVERQLILHEFKSSGAILPESIIDERIEDIIRDRYRDRVTFTKTLQEQGKTSDQFRQDARETIIIRYMIDKNVSSAIMVSPAKIESYYTNHLADYHVDDEAKLRVIALRNNSSGDTAALAAQVHAVIAGGASFAEMASVYAPGSNGREGGDWGWRELSKLNPGIAAVAKALNPGELSDVISLGREPNNDYWICHYNDALEITRGRKYTAQDQFLEELDLDPPQADAPSLPDPHEFYILLVEDKRAARIKPLDEIRQEIEAELLVEERARLQKKWVDRLKEKSFVRYFGQ